MEKNFHRKPTGTRDTFAKLTELASDPSLTTKLGNGKKMHKLSNVVTPEYVIQVSYSHYGNQAQSATSYPTKPPQMIIHGDDSRLDVLKQHLRALEDKEANVSRTLEVLEGEEQELRTKHTEVSKLKTHLADEKAMYDTKQADIGRHSEKSVSH